MTWRPSRTFWMRSAGFPLGALQQLADDRTDPDVASIRAGLFRLLEDPQVEEALFLSNREALARMRSLRTAAPERAPNARMRQRLRLAWNYLQRFHAKNDTASFFGPVTWGELVDSDVRVEVQRSEGPYLAQRQVFFEHWALRMFADSVAADPDAQPYLPLRLNRALRVEGQLLHLPGKTSDQGVVLKGAPLFVVERIVETRAGKPWSTIALAAEADRSGARSAEQVERAVAGLLERRVLVRGLEVPTVQPRAEEHLRSALCEWLPEVGTAAIARKRWLAQLDRACELAERFALAGLSERERLAEELQGCFAELSSSDLQRPTGLMYVGRYPVYEDCGASARIRVGRALLDEVSPVLQRVLDVYRWTARRLAQLLTARYRAVAAELAQDGAEGVDFLAFYRQARTVEVDAVVEHVRDELEAAWRRVLDRAVGGAISACRARPSGRAWTPRISLYPEDLDALVAALPPVANQSSSDPLGCEVHSPDLLLAAKSLEALNQGEYLLVLGEVHPALHTVSQPVAQPFCPFEEEIRAEVERILAPQALVLVDPPDGYNRSNINWPACGSLVEVVPSSCASRLEPSQQIPAGDGVVVDSEAGLEFVDLRSGRRDCLLSVMPGAWHRGLFQLASAALGAGQSARLTCGRVVLQRRSWSIAPEDLPDCPRPGEDLASYARLRKWAEGLELPRWVFIKSPDEPKPVCVDFANPIAVDVFYKQAREGALRLTEMLPSPEELWLEDARGAFTCELRTSWTCDVL